MEMYGDGSSERASQIEGTTGNRKQCFIGICGDTSRKLVSNEVFAVMSPRLLAKYI